MKWRDLRHVVDQGLVKLYIIPKGTGAKFLANRIEWDQPKPEYHIQDFNEWKVRFLLHRADGDDGQRRVVRNGRLYLLRYSDPDDIDSEMVLVPDEPHLRLVRDSHDVTMSTVGVAWSDAGKVANAARRKMDKVAEEERRRAIMGANPFIAFPEAAFAELEDEEDDDE
jgi:hypothetical protein